MTDKIYFVADVFAEDIQGGGELNNEEAINLLCKRGFSVIYEHDHKYLLTRDPSGFQNYVAPKNQVINRDFYKKASGVLCQSKLHKEVAFRNLEIDNIHNLGGNLWSDEILDFLTDLEKKTKAEKYSIWSSTNPIKNTSEVLTYCSANKIPYDLIGNLPYKNVGATSEEWFQLKGLALADRMREKKIEIVDTIVRILS